MRDISTGEPPDPIKAIVAASPPSMLPRVNRMVGPSFTDIGSLMLVQLWARSRTYSSGSLERTRPPPTMSFFCRLQRVAHSRHTHDEAGKAGGHVPPVAPSR